MLHARRASLALFAALALLLGFVTPAQAAPTEEGDLLDRSDSTRVASPSLLGQVRDQQHVHLAPVVSGVISGQLTVNDGSTDVVPSQAAVRLWRWSDVFADWVPGNFQVLDLEVDGSFSLPSAQAGRTKLEFRALYNGIPAKIYWPDSETFDAAGEVVLVDGEPEELGQVTSSLGWPSFSRIAGADRFETAVELSRRVVADGDRAEVVYLVNGYGFADALSAGPAAASRDGVLLLTGQNSLPSVVASELARIQPHEIVIVGGLAAVSESVARSARTYVDDSSDVRRIAGSDRYATSRALVADALAGIPHPHILYVATGATYPDALAAGPVASHEGTFVLLVDGSASRLPDATTSFLRSSSFSQANIVGGRNSVSSNLQGFFQALPWGVMRLAGADRFETAEIVNYHGFGEVGVDIAYVATGFGFADALAGSTLAASDGAPIFLSRPECLSTDTYVGILDLWANEAVVIGGRAAVSDRVLFGRLC